MRDLYNFQIGFRAAIYRLYRYSTPVRALLMVFLFQVSGVLELDQTPEGTARYSALDKWVNQLSQLQKVVVNKMA